MQGYLLFALLAPLATAQIPVPGACPAPPVLTDFKIADFTATPWYEHSKYYAKLEAGYDCITWTFSPSSEKVGSMAAHVDMRNTYWRHTTYMKDTLTPKNDAATANYDYVCTSMPVTHLPLPGKYPYQILVADNTAVTGYAVAWSCNPSGDSHEEILWILTKDRNTDAAVTAKGNAIAALAKLTTPLPVHSSYLGDVNQSGCTAQDEGIRIANETSTV